MSESQSKTKPNAEPKPIAEAQPSDRAKPASKTKGKKAPNRESRPKPRPRETEAQAETVTEICSHRTVVGAGFPQLPATDPAILGTFNNDGNPLLCHRGTVGTLTPNGCDLVRVARWQINPLPTLPTGFFRDCETSANHVIVRLREDYKVVKDQLPDHVPLASVRDEDGCEKLLLLEVVTKDKWTTECSQKNRRGKDLLHERLSEFQEVDVVQWAELNFLSFGHASTNPNDPAVTEQWGLRAIQAQEAWQSFNGGELPQTAVAIVDSGIDLFHADLKRNLTIAEGQVHFSTYELPLPKKLDEYPPIDLERPETYPKNFVFNPRNPMDEDHSHGTFCAGVIGAVTNNSLGIAGVHWKAALMPFKFVGPHKSGTVWDASRAIRAAVDSGAEIILAAWGMRVFSHCLYEACKYAQERGVLIVTAAGNLAEDLDRERFYPACFKVDNGRFPKIDQPYACPQCAKKKRGGASLLSRDLFYPGLDNIIVVGATEGYGFTEEEARDCQRREQKSQNSSWGREVVDLGAPGYFIRTTRKCQSSKRFCSRLGWASGTSMAAAFVAGGLALIKARYHSESYLQIKDRLLGTADHVPSLEPYWACGRRLNVYRAVEARYDGYGGYVMPGETADGATEADHPESEMDVAVLVRARNGNGKPAAADGQNGRANGHGNGHATPVHGGYGHSAHGH